MSTHATPETRHAPSAETTTDDAVAATDDEPAPMDPFDAHNAAATFGDGTERLPNTIDAENAYLG
ncbi:hypothetical protein [Halosimplex amylolyticum]|uniref:hypothetical protein n=1 Tax=Halosimplex amylolyticum TaxID=3396616 RepID=UPI003F548407